MDKGILYIVQKDEEILRECIYSLKTVKKFCPDLKCCLITDIQLSSEIKDLFDIVVIKKSELHPLKTKVKWLAETPFRNTLFMDADTALLKDISEVFQHLESNDFAFAFDNLCKWDEAEPLFIRQESKDINTGMLLFRRNAQTAEILNFWFDKIRLQDESSMSPGKNCDQIYFNRYVFDEIKSRNIAFYILSNEVYNVRPWCWPTLKASGKWHNVKMLHAHHLDRTLFSKIKQHLFGKK